MTEAPPLEAGLVARPQPAEIYHTQCWVPSPLGPSEAERLLAAANNNAWEAARTRVSEHFCGWDPLPFLQSTDDATLEVLQVDPLFVEHLRGPDVLDDLLARHDVRERLRFSREGVQESPPGNVFIGPLSLAESPRVCAARVADALDAPWTVIVNAVTFFHESLRGFMSDLDRLLGRSINSNAYLSKSDAPGFGLHWDDHDVLILPLAGSKRWQVHNPVVVMPDRRVHEPKQFGELVWEGDIEPGMALLIPRGWGHTTVGHEELALHLTINIERVRLVDLMTNLAHVSIHWPRLRGSVPARPDLRSTGREGSMWDRPGAVPAFASLVMSDEVIRHAVGYSRLRVLPRGRASFFRTYRFMHGDDDVDIQGNFPAGLLMANGPESEGWTYLAAAGKEFPIDERALPALARLVDSEAVPFGELVDLLDGDVAAADVRRLVEDLLRFDLAMVPASDSPTY